MAALLAGLGAVAARLGTFLLQFVGFLVVLLIGWLIARGIRAAINAILRRVGFDRLVQRGGVDRALKRTGYDAAGILGEIGFWAVILFTLQFGLGIFGPNPLLNVLNGVIAYLPRLFAAVLIVVIGAALAVVLREAVDAAVGGVTYGRTLAAFSGGAVLYVAAFMALDELAIAPSIVTGLFYASLAAIAGTIIVAAGGGGIPVMQQWWQRASMQVEQTAPEMAQQAQGASERVKQRAQERVQQAKEAAQPTQEERPPAGTPVGGAGMVPPASDDDRKR